MPGAGALLQGDGRGKAQKRGGGDRWTHLLLLLVIEVVPFAYYGPRHGARLEASKTFFLIRVQSEVATAQVLSFFSQFFGLVIDNLLTP